STVGTSSRCRTRRRETRKRNRPPWHCTVTHVMAEQVGPASKKPTTMVAFEAGVNDWLTLARIPSWPGAASPNRTRPKIRLQSDSCFRLRALAVDAGSATALRSHQGHAAFGGALRAALTRPTRRGPWLGCGEGMAFAAQTTQSRRHTRRRGEDP